MGREHTAVVHKYILRLVEDISAWNGFAWGSYVSSNTYASLKNAITNRMANKVLKEGQLIDKTTKPKFTFTGFLWAFKIWILETFAKHVLCWARDHAMIPRAPGWTKLSTFHINDDAPGFLSSINTLNPPIHPLEPKDNERVKDWYISSTAYFNNLHPSLAKSEKVYTGPNVKHHVGDNGKDCAHAGATVLSTEERLLTLESIIMEIHSDFQKLKNRVSTVDVEEKVKLYLEKEDDDGWHKLNDLLEEHKNHIQKENEEVDDGKNLSKLHNLEGSRSNLDELFRKVDGVESIDDPVDTRIRSVFSYESVLCDDVLVDNLVVEDTANTMKSDCPQPRHEDVQLPDTKPHNKEEAVYVLNKDRLEDILTQPASVNTKKKPFISEEEFKKSHHYQRYRADLEAKKRKCSLPWNSVRKGKPSTDQELNSRKRHLSSTRFEESSKARPVTRWIEDLTRDDPSKMYPVPTYEFYDLQNSGNLDGWHLSFSRDTIIREPFWKALLCLNYGERENGWLSDEHISIWVDYLNETRPPNADWCMVDSWFMTLLMRGDVSQLYGYGSRFKVSWAEVRRVFIPINNAGNHWTLGQFDVPTGVITIYDSLHKVVKEPTEIAWVDDMIKKVKTYLPIYLEGLGVFEKKGIDYRSYNIRIDTFPQYLTPQQRGLYGDCGVFLCIFLYRLSHGLGLEVEDPVQAVLAYRERITNLVLQYKERVYGESMAENLRMKVEKGKDYSKT